MLIRRRGCSWRHLSMTRMCTAIAPWSWSAIITVHSSLTTPPLRVPWCTASAPASRPSLRLYPAAQTTPTTTTRTKTTTRMTPATFTVVIDRTSGWSPCSPTNRRPPSSRRRYDSPATMSSLSIADSVLIRRESWRHNLPSVDHQWRSQKCELQGKETWPPPVPFFCFSFPPFASPLFSLSLFSLSATSAQKYDP